METTLTVYEIFIIGGSILGTYIKMVVEQSKIRTRLEFLEDGRLFGSRHDDTFDDALPLEASV